MNLVEIAERHIRDILSLAIQHQNTERAVIVADTRSPLANILKQAYQQALPSAQFIDFDAVTPEQIIDGFNQLKPGDLVVLIQSDSFRLNAFRIRVELFNQSLKVIEHPHLGRMLGDEMTVYVESLAYDAVYYRETGRALKNKIDQAAVGIVDSDGERLVFSAGFESAKLNIGDYSDMKNIGGQFPIGEVFTESRDLEAVNGRVRIHAFGDTTFSVMKLDEPLTLIVEKGRVVNTLNSVPEFEKVLATIRADEDDVWLRELGFGLNRAFTHDKLVTDIGTYERMCGIHLSLGAKHSVYKKPQFTRAMAKYHVDVFAVTQGVYLDDSLVYQSGSWRVL